MSKKKGPYKHLCDCGYEFIFSHKIIQDGDAICPKCYRKWFYSRNRTGKIRTWEQTGRFKNKADFERRTNAYARKAIQSEQDSQKDKKSSSLRGTKDPNTDTATGSQARVRSGKRTDKGLRGPIGASHGEGTKAEKGRVAKR